MSGDGVRPGSLRDWVATSMMVSSAPVLGLMFAAMTPALLLIARHFGGSGPVLTIPLLDIPIDGALFAQMISTAPSLGLMLAGLPVGWLIDRSGARTVLVWSLVFFALFGSAGAYIEDPFLLLLSRFLLGFAAMACGGATVWLIGGRFDDRQRARVLSVRNLLGGIFGFVFVKIAGAAAARFGWHGPFGLFLIVLLLIPAALYALPPGTPRPARRQGEAETASLGPLWPILALVVVLSVVMMMNVTQLPFLLAENGITDPGRIAQVGGVTSLAVMAGTLIYALIGPQLGARQNYSLIALALGAGVALTGLSHDEPMATIGASITAFGSGLMVPHFARTVLNLAPPAARGRAVGLNFFFTYLGDFLNPVAVHPLALVIGIHQAFLLIGAILAATALQIVVPFRARAAPAATP